jgi:hypothetical protein
MNKHSVTKKRLVKPSRSTAMRKASARKAAARPATRKPAPNSALKSVALKNGALKNGAHKNGASKNGTVKNGAMTLTAISVREVTVSEVTALSAPLPTHKFQVGQTVFFTSSPISRPGASGSYRVVRLLPSDGEDYQYRIKNPGEAFERVAKESQLEVEN